MSGLPLPAPNTKLYYTTIIPGHSVNYDDDDDTASRKKKKKGQNKKPKKSSMRKSKSNDSSEEEEEDSSAASSSSEEEAPPPPVERKKSYTVNPSSGPVTPKMTPSSSIGGRTISSSSSQAPTPRGTMTPRPAQTPKGSSSSSSSSSSSASSPKKGMTPRRSAPIPTFSHSSFPNDSDPPDPSDTANPRIIDGSLLEGGGQVLRNSFAYSSLLKFPLTVDKIRANRSNGGGLRAQHLTGIEALHEITGGKLKGADIGATKVHYIPGGGTFIDKLLSDGRLRFFLDAKTAGAIGLLIQTTLPVLLYLPYPALTIYKGGTNALHAPMFDYTQQVFFPMFYKVFNIPTADIRVQCLRRGFFPRGGGHVEIETMRPLIASPLPPLTLLKRGDIIEIRGQAITGGKVPAHVADRMIASTIKTLKSSAFLNEKIKLAITPDTIPLSQGPDDGCFLLLIAESSTGCLYGTSGIGEKGKTAESIGEEVANELLREISHGGCVDEYLQDQFIIFMALAKGRGRMKTGPISLHTETAIHWARELTGAKVGVYKAKQGGEEKKLEVVDGSSSSVKSLVTPSTEWEETTDTDKTMIIEIEGIGYESRWKSLAEEKKSNKK